MNTAEFNPRTGDWEPSPPLPLYVGWRLTRCQCQCGRRFKTESLYRSHWIRQHAPDKWEGGGQ